jgi:hypothetical protein
MPVGAREALGAVPRTFVAIVNGQEVPIFTINADGSFTHHTTVDAESEAATLAALGLTPVAAEINVLDGLGVSASIALAASATTDGMTITITVLDAAGVAVAAVHQLEFWMSEAATGIGLTADAYSGDLTIVATFGAILSAHTAKKHWSVVTNADGIFKATLVDSANPADQYVAVKKPLGAGLIVSAASGVNWEGV